MPSPLYTLQSFITLLASILALTLPIKPTFAQTYSNTAIVNIADNSVSSPYPSVINVTRGPTSIGQVVVSLNTLYHPNLSDIRVLVVAPGGQKILLLNQNIGSAPIPGNTVTFATPGGRSIFFLNTPPYVYVPAGGSFSLPAPAPPPPYLDSFTSLAGTNANGQWRLYIVDDFANNESGFLFGGWSVQFLPAPTPPTSNNSTFTYQGKLTDANGLPVSGQMEARFSLWDSDTSTNPFANRLAGPVTVSGISLSEGLFTANVNFNTNIPADRIAWVQIEASTPVGSPFVSLSPRQRLTATPVAQSVLSGGFTENTVIGPGRISGGGSGVNDPLNRGVKSLVGYASSPGGADFAGMKTSVVASDVCPDGNMTELSFLTWNCSAFPQEAIRVTSIANIGIGTATPNYPIHIARAGLGFDQWQVVISNPQLPNSLGGIRYINSGLISMSSNAHIPQSPRANLNTDGAWSNSSDVRLKTNITTAENNLAAALKLRPVNFRWKFDGSESLGLIAQEVRQVLPRLVSGDEATESLALNYSQLSVVAIGAIQELKADSDSKQRQIDDLKADAARRDAENADLKARLKAIEATLLKMNKDHQ